MLISERMRTHNLTSSHSVSQIKRDSGYHMINVEFLAQQFSSG